MFISNISLTLILDVKLIYDINQEIEMLKMQVNQIQKNIKSIFKQNLEQSNWINEINDQINLKYNEKFKKNNDIDHIST